jgi:hypothetical protein
MAASDNKSINYAESEERIATLVNFEPHKIGVDILAVQLERQELCLQLLHRLPSREESFQPSLQRRNN